MALTGCTSLTQLHIADSPTSLTDNGSEISSCPIATLYFGRNYESLSSTPYLSSLTIGEQVTSVVGLSNSKLTSVAFPASVTNINGFNSCSGLTSVAFSVGLKTISGFYCLNATSVSFPSTVTSISGFDQSALTSLELPASLMYISGFNNCAGLMSLEFTKSVISVEGFENCTSLEYAKFGKSVKGINGFRYCHQVKEIVSGSSLVNIGEAMFDESNPTTIYSLNPTPPTGYFYFSDEIVFNNADVIVPMGSLQDYQNSEVWNRFLNILEADLSEMEDYDFEDDGVYVDITSPEEKTCTVT